MIQRAAIAEAFLSAAVEPAGWLPALGTLAAATGSSHAQIVGFGRDYDVDFNWVSDVSSGLFAAFETLDGGAPAVNFRMAASLATPGIGVVHEAHYDAVRPSLTSGDYVDLCSDWDIPYGCQANLRDDENGILGLALLRSKRDGRTTPEQRYLFDVIRHDIAAATRLQVALEGQGHRLIASTFEAMSVACFVLDRGLRVRAMSSPGERLLQDGVLLLIDDRVVAVSRGAPDLDLHRLPTREWAMGFAPFAILVARGGGAPVANGADLLRETYRLTAAEADIALLLRAGQSRDRICAARHISRETLRTHLRGIFAKLDVRRETEAIHRLHILLG